MRYPKGAAWLVITLACCGDDEPADTQADASVDAAVGATADARTDIDAALSSCTLSTNYSWWTQGASSRSSTFTVAASNTIEVTSVASDGGVLGKACSIPLPGCGDESNVAGRLIQLLSSTEVTAAFASQTTFGTTANIDVLTVASPDGKKIQIGNGDLCNADAGTSNCIPLAVIQLRNALTNVMLQARAMPPCTPS